MKKLKYLCGQWKQSFVFLKPVVSSVGLSILLIGGGCASAPKHNPLIKQILKPRPDHKPFLTNQASGEDDELKTSRYDLSKESVRSTLRKLKFVCKLGKKRYRICKNQASLCRRTVKVTDRWLLPDIERETVEKLPLEEHYEFFIEAKLKCFSVDSYEFTIM